MTMKLYETMSRDVLDFFPLQGNTIRMYTCGPTVYQHCHLGHGRSYVVFDVLKRHILSKGWDVNHVQNFTDVEDIIFKRAREVGISHQEFSQNFIDAYFLDMEKLNVLKADNYPKVSQNIEAMIEAIKIFLDRKCAYELEGDIYFHSTCAKGYGSLSRIRPDMLLGSSPNGARKAPMDFLLWKKEDPEKWDQLWPSPWGMGRPGWHLQCTVMALDRLGPTLDIHGGGLDLIYPHHEHERVEAEALTGSKFCRFYLHNGFVNIDKEKMSKSKGNYTTLRELFSRYAPLAVRHYLLTHHYRSHIELDYDALERSCKALENLRDMANDTALELNAPSGLEVSAVIARLQSLREEFEGAMDSDLDTPTALGVLERYVNYVLDLKDCTGKPLSESTIQKFRSDHFFMMNRLGIASVE